MIIDNNYNSAHNNYAILLKDKLHDYDKAEYHFNCTLNNNPNNAIMHANFGYFLVSKRNKFELALSHSEKACKLKPNFRIAHFVKAISLFKLNKFNKSLTEFEICVKLNEEDGKLQPRRIKFAQENITWLRHKIVVDEEKTEIAVDQSIAKFCQLSIVEGIDEIIAQIVQIDQMIVDANVKKNLSQLQRKLENTRSKCDKIEKIENTNNQTDEKSYDTSDAASSRDDYHNYFESKVKELSLTSKHGAKDVDQSLSISLLVQVKKLEHDMKMHSKKSRYSICIAIAAVCQLVQRLCHF